MSTAGARMSFVPWGLLKRRWGLSDAALRVGLLMAVLQVPSSDLLTLLLLPPVHEAGTRASLTLLVGTRAARAKVQDSTPSVARLPGVVNVIVAPYRHLSLCLLLCRTWVLRVRAVLRLSTNSLQTAEIHG